MRRFVGATLATSSVLFHPVLASDSNLSARQATSQTITFKPCYDINYECGVYQPPLDWANPSAGNAQIAVIRYKATRQPRLGSLFTNPGGPGGSGVLDVMDGGSRTSNYTGGYYDIIGFDPRGVNNSAPRATCFSTAREEDELWAGTIQSTGIDSKGDFKDQADLDNFYNQTDSFDAKLRQFGQACQTNNENLKYIGTAATVRDIVGMADILDGVGSPISYWGVSYGTVIGAYLVNMFPDRVGRVILDSVVNPTVYAATLPHKYVETAFLDSELAFTGFCEQCAAGGDECALTDSDATTGDQVKARILKLIDNIYDASKLGFNYRSQWVRDSIFSSLYSPRNWDETATSLSRLEESVTSFLASDSAKRGLPLPLPIAPGPRRRPANVLPWEGGLPIRESNLGARQIHGDDLPYDHSFEAVTCADAVDATSVTTKDVFDEIVAVTHNLTPTFGASFTVASYYCHAYPVRAVERYTGPFNKQLAKPILIIGNKADPITPYASSKELADGFGDSAVLIERDGWGHYSGGMLSTCTQNAVSNYLIAGKLPSGDEFCKTDQPLFIDGPEPNAVDLSTNVSPVPVATGAVVSGSESAYSVTMGGLVLFMTLANAVLQLI